MGREFYTILPDGSTYYFLQYSLAGQVKPAAGAYVDYDSGDYGDYDRPLVQAGGEAGPFVGEVDANAPAGDVDIWIFRQGGGSPATTDNAGGPVGQGRLNWDGTDILGISGFVGQITAGIPVGASPVNRKIADAFTFLLGRDGAVPSSGPPIGLHDGDAVRIAWDFRDLIAAGQAISAISDVTIEDGTADGLTFVEHGVNSHQQAVIRVTAVTVDSYTVRVVILTDTGETIQGDGVIVVSA